ncbi:hypothetical protein B0T26DRAFT_363739 [Lasiosphaeria miniovina]|uniref:Uncharacterized protein n=1 Tax=Lasiosphaeria miniovina TaxID=1954250 RepID=A0AA40ACP2_9PEZI|nr:uncharacterized protein B0T26DRAFT_363739 [Lasiosphaeria miniovina]KAK0713387.1 hypothetical protein B0T26DRAFT_363739 [Lasiosphaeria miniovina]
MTRTDLSTHSFSVALPSHRRATRTLYGPVQRMQQSSPSISPEVIVAIALGIPALFIALLSLWVTYLSFTLSRSHIRPRSAVWTVALRPIEHRFQATGAEHDELPTVPYSAWRRH